MNTRICSQCGQEKSLEEFDVNKTKPLGRSYRCQECRRIYDRQHSSEKARKPTKIMQVAKWHQSERGKMMDKQRRLAHKAAIGAKNILNYYVEKGIIQRLPCVKCGNVNSQGHHPDYSKPLEVIWLCQAHHTEEHKRINGFIP